MRVIRVGSGTCRIAVGLLVCGMSTPASCATAPSAKATVRSASKHSPVVCAVGRKKNERI